MAFIASKQYPVPNSMTLSTKAQPDHQDIGAAIVLSRSRNVFGDRVVVGHELLGLISGVLLQVGR
jgi:hypothetical protein